MVSLSLFLLRFGIVCAFALLTFGCCIVDLFVECVVFLVLFGIGFFFV